MTVAQLARGANAPLTAAVPGLRRVLVTMAWTAAPGMDVDAQVILVGADGRAGSPDDLLFTWQLAAAGPGVPAPVSTSETVEAVLVDLAAVPDPVDRIVFCAAIYAAAARHHSFAAVAGASLTVAASDVPGGGEAQVLARHDLAAGTGAETAMIFGELYRHAGGWKVRAVGQGYTGGLAAVARDVGIAT